MTLSKAEKDAGYIAAPQPTAAMTTILRRVAMGHLQVTLTDEGVAYTYDDGTPIIYGKKPIQKGVVERAAKAGWLIPIEKESMFDGPPQRYRARNVDDGPLPKFYKP